ncbi:MAG: hypothetical protein IJ320_06135 [Phascolarctobacterium sp.]|nr:hypothetical protein [Phascolarctobacterium sp.]
MCNYAVNSITFSSRNSKLLRELHKKVLSCYDDAVKGKNLVRDLLKSHGYLLPLGVNNTDHFSHCEEFITSKRGVHYFSCETTTAWSENMLPIINLLKEKYHNEIHLSFCSEDGGDIFIVKDDTGVFYPDRYKVEWRINGVSESEYFKTYKALFTYLRTSFPKAYFGYFDTLDDIERSIDQIYGSLDKEYYFYIHRFKEYHNEMAEFMAKKEVA